MNRTVKVAAIRRRIAFYAKGPGKTPKALNASDFAAHPDSPGGRKRHGEIIGCWKYEPERTISKSGIHMGIICLPNKIRARMDH